MMRALSPTGFLAIAALAALMSSVDQYLFAAYSIPPLALQLAALASLLLHLLVSMFGRRIAIGRSQMLCFAILYGYLVWTAVSYLYAEPSDIVVDVLIGRLKAALFIILGAIVLARQDMRNAFSIACVFLVALATVLNIYDFISPTFSQVPGRSAGFYINPNQSGSALDMLPMMASTAIPATANFLVLGMAAIGLLVTFSRSGWIIFLLGGLGLALYGRLGGGRARFVFLGIVALLFGALFYAYWSGDLFLFMSGSSLGEFLDPNTLARLGSRGAALDDYSSLERTDVANKGFDAFLASPLLGHGVGYTYVWDDRTSTHNMLLLMGAELGMPGILLYLSLFVVMIARARGVPRLLAIMLLADGMFTHNQLDFLSSVIPIAFVIAALDNDAGRRSVAANGISRSRERDQQ